jgi:hypothetical protein
MFTALNPAQPGSHRKQSQAVSGKAEESEASPPAIRRIGRPAAVARRAARRVAIRQMPQAYLPQRGIGKRATKDKARTAALAVVMTGALPPYPRDLTHWGRQQGWGRSLLEMLSDGKAKESRRRPKTPPVPYGPADGARVASPHCPILHGGANTLPDASIVCPIFFQPMLAAPKR